MNTRERLEYAEKELEAIYEDLDLNIKQTLLIKKFIKHLLDFLKGSDSSVLIR